MRTTITEKHTESWAEQLGAKVAAHRVEREAARKAEAELTEGRDRLPVDFLAKRFAEVAVLVLEAVDHFGRAAEIPIDPDPVAAGSVRLAGPGADRVWLRRVDDQLVVEVRSLSRSEEWSVDMTVEEFSPPTIARRIAEQFCRQLAASEEGSHGTR